MVILVENLPVPLDRRVWLEATSLRDAGWHVVVIGPRGSGGMRHLRDTTDGIEVLRYPQFVAGGIAGYILEYVPSLLFTLMWFLWARARGPVHVIHGCNPPDLFWLFGRLGRVWGAKYVFDQHDPNPELSLSKFGDGGPLGRLLHRLTLALEAASYRTASLVITVNETCRAIAVERSRLPADKVLVVRNAPNLEAHRALARDIAPEGRGVGYVGVMGGHDGLEVLVEAWGLVKREPDLADVRLDLVGDGPVRAALERDLEERGLAASVRFWGFLGPSDYVPILARCVLGVSPDPPTPFNDLASMVKIIDYLAVGRGCVSFGLTETVRLGGDALKVASGNDAAALAAALVDVLRDPAQIARLSENATARAAELDLDWATQRAILLAGYSTLLGS